MTRIGRLFESLKRDGRKGLIAYITAGDPSPERTPALVEALVRGGADLIELGVPFSDPIADGPVIQRGGQRALKAGTTLKAVLEMAAAIRQRPAHRAGREGRPPGRCECYRGRKKRFGKRLRRRDPLVLRSSQPAACLSLGVQVATAPRPRRKAATRGRW